jgi:hypothetical protein
MVRGMRGIRLRAAGLGLVLCSCAALRGPTEDPAPRVRGPLPLRTTGPLVLNFMALPPRAARTLAAGHTEVSLRSAYASIFENGTGPGEEVVFDGELWRNEVSLRYGLDDSSDVEVQLGFLYATSGFLDVFVLNWHEVFGLPNGGREERDEFDYDMFATLDGTEVFRLESDELGLQDIPVIFTQQLLQASWLPELSLRLGLELPVGSESRGFGNGALDFGGGLLLDQTVGRWTLGCGVGWVKTEESDAFDAAGIEGGGMLHAHGTGELRWNDTTSWLFQLRYASSATDEFTIEEIGGDTLELDIGLAHDLGPQMYWWTGLSEDLISESGPDFAMFAGLVYRF